MLLEKLHVYTAFTVINIDILSLIFLSIMFPNFHITLNKQ